VPDPRFTARFPAREQMLGYWVKLDSPVSTERLTRIGYDYSALDAQHGLLSYAGVLAGLTAIDAGRQSGGHGAGSRPPTPTYIGKALDAGPGGGSSSRSWMTRRRPLRRSPRRRTRRPGAAPMDPCAPVYGAAPTPADSDGTRLVIIMIGTPLGLANVRELCATPGVNGVYVGPSDLCLAVGAPPCRSRLRTSRPMASVPRRWSADGSALAAVRSCSSGG
jgi:4-hydroxy-2-oxoheptanedioate aldolase